MSRNCHCVQVCLRSMRRCRAPCCLTVVVLTIYITLLLLYQLWVEWIDYETPQLKEYSFHDVQDVVLVWWTPFTGDKGSFVECGPVRCFVTQDRRFRQHHKFQTFLFYGSNFEAWDLPLPRHPNECWALLHEESPKNVPLLSHAAGLSLFNHASTFSRYSDVPLTLQYLHSTQSLTDRTYFVPLEKKNKLLSKLAPILYVQSDCDTPLDRDSYVKELMYFIQIDSYGACLKNNQLPDFMSNPAKSMESEDFLHFVARYKFTLSFENAVCDDYITEKLWRTLTVGSVPIYLGSPSVHDWLPNNNSAILVSEFKSPKALAGYISHLNLNDAEYSSMLSHKNGLISNKRLLSAMQDRQWGLPEDSDYHFINHFECEMCRKAHLHAEGVALKSQVTQKEYNCPKPLSSLTGKEDPSNPWLDHWKYGKCEAAVLHDLVNSGTNLIKRDEFSEKVGFRFQGGKC